MFKGITNISGVAVGHCSDFEAITGCTVIIFENGAVGGVDIRGGATGTREFDSLSPLHIVDKVNAVCLSGGSAFGLDAACGVMEYLEDKGIGFDVGKTVVPIVPSAILFDLGIGDYKRRPDREMGYEACRNARKNRIEEGSIGAGTGATVGKLFGVTRAMKGGVGIAVTEIKNGASIAALAVVNAFGDVYDEKRGIILAGCRNSRNGRSLINTSLKMKSGFSRKSFYSGTTLGVVLTDIKFTKIQSQKVAQMVQNSLAKVVSPVHTMFDGDIVFAFSCGEKNGDVNVTGLVASELMAEAVKRGVTEARSLGGIPSYKDIFCGSNL